MRQSRYSDLLVTMIVSEPKFQNTGTNSNEESYAKIRAYLERRGRATVRQLADLIPFHKHGTARAKGPESFVRYCIRNEWLQIVPSIRELN
jgi:hypothetical protein